MKAKNALVAVTLAGLVFVGLLVVLGRLDEEFQLSLGVEAAILTIGGALVLINGIALAFWSDEQGSDRWHFREVAVALVVLIGALLVVTWGLAWAKDRFDLRQGILPAAISIFGGLLVAVSLGLLARVLGRVRGAPLSKRRRGAASPRMFEFGPAFAFWLGVAYLLVLLGLAVAYSFSPTIQDKLQQGVVGNVLPIGVPWYGALGAVTISLYGVFRHNDEWQRKYNYWHVARPLVGAVLGMLAYFIFISVLNATASGETRNVDFTKPQALIIYYVLAFVVGYREESFRDLITKAADLLFRPGGVAGEGVIDFVPSPPIPYKSKAGTPSEPVDIQFRNFTGTGLAVAGDGVTFSGGESGHWKVESPTDPGDKQWWQPGKPSAALHDTSLWIRTRWTPAADAKSGDVESTTMLVAYSGKVGPPKMAQLIGEVE